jgi:hypothetical protein
MKGNHMTGSSHGRTSLYGETPKYCSALISQISQIVAEGLRDASLIVESAKLESKRGTS